MRTCLSVETTSGGMERRSSTWGDSMVLSSTSRITTSSIGIRRTSYRGGTHYVSLERIDTSTCTCAKCISVHVCIQHFISESRGDRISAANQIFIPFPFIHNTLLFRQHLVYMYMHVHYTINIIILCICVNLHPCKRSVFPSGMAWELCIGKER